MDSLALSPIHSSSTPHYRNLLGWEIWNCHYSTVCDLQIQSSHIVPPDKLKKNLWSIPYHFRAKLSLIERIGSCSLPTCSHSPLAGLHPLPLSLFLPQGPLTRSMLLKRLSPASSLLWGVPIHQLLVLLRSFLSMFKRQSTYHTLPEPFLHDCVCSE